ncbi:riboflavin biosynthesis protein RibD [Candidatus Peregrinibacteria bacterium CG_4_10_14_3_um_filter_44_21]|nr:MAG: riboflavin biosynthesis protein RibD [Candidatus Peregrinibacteria bacterium CG2_30_44_17]PIX79745.1 MAG: riboflavin biosynthesis protein RibD [Candidatus Peregrinibacteria bacterium CG_4_10_14_3_um_filter_44_21]
MSKDEFFIETALKLAQKAGPLTYPNPKVGAVIVKNGKIIGRGYHKKFGMPHAEVEAFNNCIMDPSGGTLYVTLEPCSHHGKTPPCTDLILSKKIKRVVCSSLDPNPKVEGAKILKEAGLEVSIAARNKEAIEINKAFFKYQQTRLPYITLKIASSMDFKIWSPRVAKLTGKKSLKLVHELRAQVTSILVGINTILKDDPKLNVRLVKGRSPAKIILDSKLKVPLKAKALTDKNVIICTEVKSSPKRSQLESMGIRILTFPTLQSLRKVMEKLARLGHINILVEGGQRISSSFMAQGLADKLILFVANKSLGGTGLEAITNKSIPAFKLTKVASCEQDTLLEFDL